MSAPHAETDQIQLEEPKQIAKGQTVNQLPSQRVPSQHYVQGYPTRQKTVSQRPLQNSLLSNLFPNDQQAMQANQQKQFQQEQVQRRHEQLRRQQLLQQQKVNAWRQAKIQQQMQAKQVAFQEQVARQVSTSPLPVNQYTNSQIVQSAGNASANSYQRNIGTVAWYDPFGVLLHSLDSKNFQQVQTSTVQKQTGNSAILKASDHEGVVAAAVANASKRFNVNQVDYRQISKKPSSEIRQVSHDSASSKVVDVSSVTAATTSSDLHKPWNVEEFMKRRSSTENPYRLVSDIQEKTNKTPPPQSDFGQISPASTSTKQIRSTQAKANVSKERAPIFSLGKHLANEFRPSNDRKWSQNHAVLQTAEFNGNLATIRNVRYSKYQPSGDYTTIYYDATFNLNEIRTIDLVIVPFHALPTLAHVQASFGFADGRHIALSIEARYEEGEQYDPVAASMRQFELIYVLADERDLIRIGTDVNNNDVHIYRLKFEPSEVREMFVDALNRSNSLAKKPEFYHPLRNSCVTNLINHINKGRPRAIPREYRTLLPGLMDQYVFDLKLIDTTAVNFNEAKENAKVNWLVEKYGDLEYFSAGIRQNMY